MNLQIISFPNQTGNNLMFCEKKGRQAFMNLYKLIKLLIQVKF